ncbi:Toxin FitB [Candidatus Arcanobacter lacustris]|uniref:Toxin FitB n=1 Tax=Candidatus Arcanibacter lacustris TaxID=1607817 RepID=A0A0F5MQ51_9RICK|nr:Toxin FitB [Candidatus Arcanobacter lacustris]
MYLLDTNIISETIKINPNPKVIAFLKGFDISNFSLSVITLGEIRKGIEKLSDRSKKQKIIQWLEVDLANLFYGRIINIDPEIADKWGYLLSLNNAPPIDCLIAASAIVRNHKLITRNIKDFKAIKGLEVINPWEL